MNLSSAFSHLHILFLSPPNTSLSAVWGKEGLSEQTEMSLMIKPKQLENYNLVTTSDSRHVTHGNLRICSYKND